MTKLAQGQFVATAQLEQLYATQSPLIDQIFLYANARHAALLAVVVTAAERGQIRQELERIARAAGRPAHEIPRDFVIEREPFSVANELLTEVTGVPCYVADQPANCVAIGTGLALEHLDVLSDSLEEF